MRINKKENNNQSITLNLDRKNYLNFMNEVKALGKKYEFKSNENNLKYSVYLSGNRIPYMNVKGWCSRVQDPNGRVSEVFFADYDNCLYRVLESEVKYLMEKYDLPPVYVFTSKEEKDDKGEVFGNYMVVCLKKNTFKQVIDMQDSLHCDAVYKKIAYIYRFKTWVLRLGPKGSKPGPVFKEVIGDLTKNYLQEASQAHLELLESIYDVPKIKYKNLDGNNSTNLFLTEYKTASP